MTRSLRTRPELEAEIVNARAACVQAEDHTPTDPQAVKEARARVDAALEAWARAR